MSLVRLFLLGLLFKLGNQLFLALAGAKGVFRTARLIVLFVSGGVVAFFGGTLRFVIHDFALSARGRTIRSRCGSIAAIRPVNQAGTA